jgi:hypothetical protein
MTLINRKWQVGSDADASKNFTIQVPDVQDGSLEIRRGNADAPGAVVAKIQPGVPVFFLSAFGRFNGSGGVTSFSGENCSVVRNSAGTYTVTFDSPMPTANYTIFGSADSAFGGVRTIAGTDTVNGFQFTTSNSSNVPADCSWINFGVVI